MALTALAAHPKLHTLTMSYNSDLVVDSLPLTLTHLTLENVGLTEFPPAVLKLRELVVLNVGRNKITAFPARPMRMPHLKQLNIQSCDIRRLPGYLAGTMKLDRIFTDMCPLRQPNQVGCNRDVVARNHTWGCKRTVPSHSFPHAALFFCSKSSQKE